MARKIGPEAALPIFQSADEAKIRTWVHFARTFQLIHRRLTSMLARHDLTMPQFDVLATLRFSEGVNQQELSQRLLVTKGNVCGVLDRMEALGWVERRPDDLDKRANRLHLSATGKRKIDAVLPRHDLAVLQALRPLTPAETDSLRNVLTRLADENENLA